MTPVDWAEFLSKYGGWGTSVLLGMAVVVLYRALMSSQNARIRENKENGQLMERLLTAINITNDLAEHRVAAAGARGVLLRRHIEEERDAG